MNNYKVIFFFLFFFYRNYYTQTDVAYPEYEYHNGDNSYLSYDQPYGKTQTSYGTSFLQNVKEYKTTFKKAIEASDKFQDGRSKQKKTTEEAQNTLGEIRMNQAVNSVKEGSQLDSFILPEQDSVLIFFKNLMEFVFANSPEIVGGFLNPWDVKLRIFLTYFQYFMSSVTLGNKDLNTPFDYAWTSVIKSSQITINGNWNISGQLIFIKPQEQFKSNETQRIVRISITKKIPRKKLIDDVYISAHWGTYQNGHIMGVQGFTILAGAFHGIFHCSFKKNMNEQYIILAFNVYISFIFTKLSLYFVIDINQLKQILKQIKPHFALEINLWAKTKRDKTYMEEFDINGFNSILSDIAEIQPILSGGNNFIRKIVEQTIKDDNKFRIPIAMQILTQDVNSSQNILSVDLKKDEWRKIEPVLKILQTLIDFDEEKFSMEFNKNTEDLAQNYQKLMEIKQSIIENDKKNKTDIQQFQIYEIVFKKIQNNFNLIKKTIKDNIGLDVNLKKAEVFLNHLYNNLSDHTNEIIPIYKKNNIHLSSDIPNLQEENFKSLLDDVRKIAYQTAQGKNQTHKKKKKPTNFDANQEKTIEESQEAAIKLNDEVKKTQLSMIKIFSFIIEEKLKEHYTLELGESKARASTQEKFYAFLSKIADPNPISFETQLIKKIMVEHYTAEIDKKPDQKILPQFRKTCEELMYTCSQIKNPTTQNLHFKFYENLNDLLDQDILLPNDEINPVYTKQYTSLLKSHQKEFTINDSDFSYGFLLSRLYKNMQLTEKIDYINESLFDGAVDAADEYRNPLIHQNGAQIKIYPNVAEFFEKKLDQTNSMIYAKDIPVDVFYFFKDLKAYDIYTFNKESQRVFAVDYPTFLTGMEEKNEEKSRLLSDFPGLNPKKGSATAYKIVQENIEFPLPVSLSQAQRKQIFQDNNTLSFKHMSTFFSQLTSLEQKSFLIDMGNKIKLYTEYTKQDPSNIIYRQNDAFSNYVLFFNFLYECCAIKSNIDLINKLQSELSSKTLTIIDKNILQNRFNGSVEVFLKNIAFSFSNITRLKKIFKNDHKQEEDFFYFSNLYTSFRANYNINNEYFLKKILDEKKNTLDDFVDKIDTRLTLKNIEINFENSCFLDREKLEKKDPYLISSSEESWVTKTYAQRRKDIDEVASNIIKNPIFDISTLFESDTYNKMKGHRNHPTTEDGWIKLLLKKYIGFESNFRTITQKDFFELLQRADQQNNVAKNVIESHSRDYYKAIGYHIKFEYELDEFFINIRKAVMSASLQYINMQSFFEREIIQERMENFYGFFIREGVKLTFQQSIQKDNHLLNQIKNDIEILNSIENSQKMIISQSLSDNITKYIKSYQPQYGRTINELWDCAQNNKKSLNEFFNYMSAFGIDLLKNFNDIANFFDFNFLNSLKNDVEMALSTTYANFYTVNLKFDHDEYKKNKIDLTQKNQELLRLQASSNNLTQEELRKNAYIRQLNTELTRLKGNLSNLQNNTNSSKTEEINNITEAISTLQQKLEKNKSELLTTTNAIQKINTEQQEINTEIQRITREKAMCAQKTQDKKNSIQQEYEKAKTQLLDGLKTKIDQQIIKINELLGKTFTVGMRYNGDIFTQLLLQTEIQIGDLINHQCDFLITDNVDNLKDYALLNEPKLQYIQQLVNKAQQEHKQQEERIIRQLNMNSIRFQLYNAQNASFYATEGFLRQDDGLLKFYDNVFNIQETYREGARAITMNQVNFFSRKKTFTEVRDAISTHKSRFNIYYTEIMTNFSFLQNQLEYDSLKPDIIRQAIQTNNIAIFREIIEPVARAFKQRIYNKYQQNIKPRYELTAFFDLMKNPDEEILKFCGAKKPDKDLVPSDQFSFKQEGFNDSVYIRNFHFMENFEIRESTFLDRIEYFKKNLFPAYIVLKPKTVTKVPIFLKEEEIIKTKKPISNEFALCTVDGMISIDGPNEAIVAPILAQKILDKDRVITPFVNWDSINRLTDKELFNYLKELRNLFPEKDKEENPEEDLDEREKILKKMPLYPKFEESETKAIKDKLGDYIEELERIVEGSDSDNKPGDNDIEKQKSNFKKKREILDLVNHLEFYWEGAGLYQKSLLKKVVTSDFSLNGDNQKSNNNVSSDAKQKVKDFFIGESLDFVEKISNICSKIFGSGYDPQIESPQFNTAVDLIGFIVDYFKDVENNFDIVAHIFLIYHNDTLTAKSPSILRTTDIDPFLQELRSYLAKFKIINQDGRWVLANPSEDFHGKGPSLKTFTDSINLTNIGSLSPLIIAGFGIHGLPKIEILKIVPVLAICVFGENIGEKLKEFSNCGALESVVKFTEQYKIAIEFVENKRQERPEYAIAQAYNLKNSMEVLNFTSLDGLNSYSKDKNSSEPTAIFAERIRKTFEKNSYSLNGVLDVMIHLNRTSFNQNQKVLGPFGVFEKIVGIYGYYEFFFQYLLDRCEDESQKDFILKYYNKMLKFKNKFFEFINNIKQKIIKGDNIIKELTKIIEGLDQLLFKNPQILNEYRKESSDHYQQECDIMEKKMNELTGCDSFLTGVVDPNNTFRIDPGVLYNGQFLSIQYNNFKNEKNLQIILQVLTIKNIIDVDNPQLSKQLFNKDMMDYISLVMAEMSDGSFSIEDDKIPIIFKKFLGGFERADFKAQPNNNQKYNMSMLLEPIKPIVTEKKQGSFVTINLPEPKNQLDKITQKVNLFSETSTKIDEDESFATFMNAPIVINHKNQEKTNIYSLCHSRQNNNFTTPTIDVRNYLKILFNQLLIKGDELNAFISDCKEQAKEVDIAKEISSLFLQNKIQDQVWKPNYRIVISTLRHFLTKLENFESLSTFNLILANDFGSGRIQEVKKFTPQFNRLGFVDFGVTTVVKLFNLYNREAAGNFIFFLVQFAMIIKKMPDEEIKSFSPLNKKELIQSVLGILNDEDFNLNKEAYKKLQSLADNEDDKKGN